MGIKLFLFSILSTSLFAVTLTAQTTLEDTLTHDGINRTYRLYVPANFQPSDTVPLVLNLHGYGSNSFQQEAYGDFRPIADTANFLVVHPNGLKDNNDMRFWDAFDSSPVDDIGFLSSLIDTISNNYNIDHGRVYSTGMSNGGFMSHQLACRLSDRIAAIASVTGTMTPDQRNSCAPTHPMPVMQIHGTADSIVPYYGNNQNLAVDSVVKYWVTNNNCSFTPTVMQVPDTDTSDGCAAEHWVYENGQKNTRVEHYKVIDGEHTWPGSSINVGVTNQDFNASKVIWEFFSRYKLNQLTTNIARKVKPAKECRLAPNPSRGQFSIMFHNASSRKVSVYTSLGEKVASFTTQRDHAQIELTEAGLYFVTVEQDDQIVTKEVLIE